MKGKFLYILSIVSLLLAAFTRASFCSPFPGGRCSQPEHIHRHSHLIRSSYSPQPGDEKLIRDVVFMNFAKSRLIVSATRPVQVQAVLVGNLPDPCHVLRVVLGATTVTKTINISVYSLVKPGSSCATVLQPFSVTVPLGSFSSGSYTVFVNGTKLGTFSAGAATTTLGG